MYPELKLLIGGSWTDGSTGESLPVHNPATGALLGQLPIASAADVDAAVDAAARAFVGWKAMTALERGRILARIGQLLRSRASELAPILTMEQGKPLAEAHGELTSAADNFEWAGEEGKRLCGRIVPSRFPGADQYVLNEPIGVVAALSPWNFPAVLATRKIAMALAAGCTLVIKPAEETPGILVAIAHLCLEAGLPAGALNMVFGIPAQISERLIRSPQVKKISFTGSVPVGKQLSALAGQEMKPITLELGGHSPVLVMEDADVKQVAKLALASKFRNAGQICMAPTRFYVHDTVFDQFVECFAEGARSIKVGDGLESGVTMGPLVSARRVAAMESLTADACNAGARLICGGARPQGVPREGSFWEPTVLADVPGHARVMTEEPFGPMALMVRIRSVEDALERANRSSYGLASFAFTDSARSISTIRSGIQAGSISINTSAITPPELPFGGVKDSGLGVEMGVEGLSAYTTPKVCIQAA